MNIFIILLSCIIVSFSLNASETSLDNKSERVETRRGNKEYNSDNYVGSEINYRKALYSFLDLMYNNYVKNYFC